MPWGSQDVDKCSSVVGNVIIIARFGKVRGGLLGGLRARKLNVDSKVGVLEYAMALVSAEKLDRASL